MKQHQAPIPVHGLLRLPQVLSIIPISKSAWWEGCRTGRYPKPVKLGPRTTVWDNVRRDIPPTVRYPKPVKVGPRTTVWRAEDIAAFIKNLGRQGENHE